MHNPQTSFEAACSLCRKTAIQDTIVVGVAGSMPPAAFYAGPPTLPSSLARHKRHDHSAGSTDAGAPPSLADALTKLSESITAINSQLASQAAINKSVEGKLSKLTSQISRDRDRDSDRTRIKQANGNGQRLSGPLCSYCNRAGHSVESCYKKQRDDQGVSRPAATAPRPPRTPSAYVEPRYSATEGS